MDLLLKSSGEISTQLLLDGPVVQTAFSSNSTLNNGTTTLEVTEIGTYTATPRSNGLLYGEGQGVITPRNNEIITWTSEEIGIMNQDERIVFKGRCFLERYHQYALCVF